MVTLYNRQISIMVLFAVALHYGWAWYLMRSNVVLGVNAIYAINQWPMSLVAGTAPALAAVLVVAATMALAGLLFRTSWSVLLLVPQQLLLTFSMAGALNSQFLGHFADGAPYPPDFIGADQLYSILVAVFHTLAIYRHARRSPA